MWGVVATVCLDCVGSRRQAKGGAGERPVADPALVLLRASEQEVICAEKIGPTKLAAKLASSLRSAESKAAWAEEARASAIVGSCPRSQREVCWRGEFLLFVDAVHLM